MIDRTKIKPEIRTFLEQMDLETEKGKKSGVVELTKDSFFQVFPDDIELFKGVVGAISVHLGEEYKLNSDRYDLQVQFGGDYKVRFKRKDEQELPETTRRMIEYEKRKFGELCSIAKNRGLPMKEVERLSDRVQRL